MLDVTKAKANQRLKTASATSTFVKPLTKAELASIAIERRSIMGLSLDTLIAAKASQNIGEGRGKTAAPIAFRFAISDLTDPTTVGYLRKQAITLQANHAELGWTIPADVTLKNPTQTVAMRLASELAKHDLKLRYKVNEKAKTVTIMLHTLALSEYETRKAAKKAAEKAAAILAASEAAASVAASLQATDEEE